MPYITQDRRTHISAQGNDLIKYFTNLPLNQLLGELNYLIFRIVKSWINKNGKKYSRFASIIGTLECCKTEIYRKLIVPYEEGKEDKNGRIL
jgi:hypothetical protein